MHVVGGIGSQKDNQPGQFVRLSPSSAGNTVHDLRAANRIVPQGFGQIGIEISGGNAIYIDSAAAPGNGQRFG